MMMMLVNLAAAAVTAALAVSSGQNMLQTARIARRENVEELGASGSGRSKLFQPSDSTDNIVEQFQSLKRKDLLEIYFSSQAPKDVADIQGEWDGCLLDNNSWIMTSVTALLTDRLFGKGKRWNGKKFGINNIGINRFHPRKQNRKDSNDSNSLEEHRFDMTIRPTKLGAAKEPSLILDYTQYQSRLSLWRTMMDEIRIVPLEEGDTRVLIGLGYMSWSGGRLNASPFLLYSKKSNDGSIGSIGATDEFDLSEQ